MPLNSGKSTIFDMAVFTDSKFNVHVLGRLVYQEMALNFLSVMTFCNGKICVAQSVLVDEYSMMSHCQSNAKTGV